MDHSALLQALTIDDCLEGPPPFSQLASFTALASVATGRSLPTYMIFDRVWMHGTAQDETTEASMSEKYHHRIVDPSSLTSL